MAKHIETKNKIAKANAKWLARRLEKMADFGSWTEVCKIGPVPEGSPLDESNTKRYCIPSRPDANTHAAKAFIYWYVQRG